MKKHLQQTVDIPDVTKLVNPRCRGTLIVGEFRTGSHFLAELCEDRASELGLKWQQYQEITTNDRTFVSYLQETDTTSYQILIINLSEHKQELTENPHLVDDWVVIRLIPRDRMRWFVSWFFFCFHDLKAQVLETKVYTLSHARFNGRTVLYFGNEASGHYYTDDNGRCYIASWDRQIGSYADISPPTIPLNYKKYRTYHHGTKREVYEKFLQWQSWKKIDGSFWRKLHWALLGHVIGAMVPADCIYAYEDLVALKNDRVRWIPNQYPDRDILAEIDDGWAIKELLDRYQDPIIGKRKSLMEQK